MRKLLLLATAAALSAACHTRAEDEVGAAPDQGDTTAVTHVIDSTRTGPPGVGGRPGDATVTPDSVGIDSAAVTPGATDTTSMDRDTTLTATPQDTLGPRDTGDSTTTWGDSVAIDTTGTNQ
jgi:hypothetical protein